MDTTNIRNSLIETLGLDKLPETRQAEILEEIGKIIYQGVFLRVMEEMDDKQKDEFEKVIDQAKSPEEILVYLEEHVPAVGTILEEEVERFRSESARFLQKIGA